MAATWSGRTASVCAMWRRACPGREAGVRDVGDAPSGSRACGAGRTSGTHTAPAAQRTSSATSSRTETAAEAGRGDAEGHFRSGRYEPHGDGLAAGIFPVFAKHSWGGKIPNASTMDLMLPPQIGVHSAHHRVSDASTRRSALTWEWKGYTREFDPPEWGTPGNNDRLSARLRIAQRRPGRRRHTWSPRRTSNRGDGPFRWRGFPPYGTRSCRRGGRSRWSRR